MIQFLLDRKEPSATEVRTHQNFEEILAAHRYQQQVNNPWRYWLFATIGCFLLFLI
ncbi:MAG: hypothetical protein ACKOWM_00680 [Sphingomonadales bacterium]|jgi:hypothetical protein